MEDRENKDGEAQRLDNSEMDYVNGGYSAIFFSDM